MTEENEIPMVCTKYDELSSAISGLESDIENLNDEIKSDTETIKEYIQILKDSKEVGIDLSYYQKRLNEINEELLNKDKIIDNNIEQLNINYKDRDELITEINKIGWWKIEYFFGNSRWNKEAEAREKLKIVFGAHRII